MRGREPAVAGGGQGQQNSLLKSFGHATLCAATEFHAAEIYHRKKNFKTWENFEQRMALLGSSRRCSGGGRIDIQDQLRQAPRGPDAEDIAIHRFMRAGEQFREDAQGARHAHWRPRERPPRG